LATQPRIIVRSRLTAMLDESSMRIRLLVGPAGYGKTTLAQQWLSDPRRRDVWYRGGRASADVAALAVGIAQATSKIVPHAGRRMRDRLLATGHPEDDVEILADIFAEDVQEWPDDAWLAFDDYQFAMESQASERFVDLLTHQTPLQMLIATRRRPSWATARRVLYGDLQEIDRRALAMEDLEARAVLNRDDLELGNILERAQGWPAVIGLLALNAKLHAVDDNLPDQLYDYFAQEVYEALASTDRLSLGALSFVSFFDNQFAELLLGSEAGHTIEAGLRSGILTQPERTRFELHPLFSRLLQERAFVRPAERQRSAARAGRALLALQRWDDAFDVACRFEITDLLVSAVDSALEALIESGRFATITRWLEAAAALHCHAPVLDLAEAEVAFRTGEHRKAESLAAHAAKRLPSGSQFGPRAYLRAGHGALLASREQESIHYFKQARHSARNSRELREALFGLYSAMSELERPEASVVLDELKRLEADTPEDHLRKMALRLTHAVREGHVQEVLESVQNDVHFLDKTTDALIATSFLHGFSNALSLGGHYDSALGCAEKLRLFADEHRMDFVRPFALIDRANARVGLRDFARARRDMDFVSRMVCGRGDAHIEGNLAAIRCRLLVAIGRPFDAAQEIQGRYPPRGLPAPLGAEILAGRALAFACATNKKEALVMLEKAEAVSARALVVRVLAPTIRGICSTRAIDALDYARNGWLMAVTTGNFDSLVAAYRGYPELLEWIASTADHDHLAAVLRRANDVDLARRCGIIVGRDAVWEEPLTPREIEVMNLVATGLSNKEAAEALFVTEGTVKVHLRHVYEKLDVRGRSEAVARWVTRP
jgi:LuxR family transcriptional regulator, maltose regulon positive regulatory protein